MCKYFVVCNIRVCAAWEDFLQIVLLPKNLAFEAAVHIAFIQSQFKRATRKSLFQ